MVRNNRNIDLNNLTFHDLIYLYIQEPSKLTFLATFDLEYHKKNNMPSNLALQLSQYIANIYIYIFMMLGFLNGDKQELNNYLVYNVIPEIKYGINYKEQRIDIYFTEASSNKDIVISKNDMLCNLDFKSYSKFITLLVSMERFYFEKLLLFILDLKNKKNHGKIQK